MVVNSTLLAIMRAIGNITRGSNDVPVGVQVGKGRFFDALHHAHLGRLDLGTFVLATRNRKVTQPKTPLVQLQGYINL